MVAPSERIYHKKSSHLIIEIVNVKDVAVASAHIIKKIIDDTKIALFIFIVVMVTSSTKFV